ncbi:hypothetical protein KC331_g6369 [Hortaea werneckii]|uniref:Uncharacterized protein n=1 Tax=Hortaea werneckii TaxID=91943 RepID=A0A3M7BUE9_HORWE|nr:hypothetical protein KC331_g6369 [Hortaea werneckii]KAI7709499.1 hypothetical protein KC353_g10310 [Hortaea werneckii]RMY43324.1 hypothetical protein D0865_11332 [Hortaea werneckii]
MTRSPPWTPAHYAGPIDPQPRDLGNGSTFKSPNHRRILKPGQRRDDGCSRMPNTCFAAAARGRNDEPQPHHLGPGPQPTTPTSSTRNPASQATAQPSNPPTVLAPRSPSNPATTAAVACLMPASPPQPVAETIVLNFASQATARPSNPPTVLAPRSPFNRDDGCSRMPNACFAAAVSGGS